MTRLLGLAMAVATHAHADPLAHACATGAAADAAALDRESGLRAHKVLDVTLGEPRARLAGFTCPHEDRWLDPTARRECFKIVDERCKTAHCAVVDGRFVLEGSDAELDRIDVELTRTDACLVHAIAYVFARRAITPMIAPFGAPSTSEGDRMIWRENPREFDAFTLVDCSARATQCRLETDANGIVQVEHARTR
jgi:hypothetical protein